MRDFSSSPIDSYFYALPVLKCGLHISTQNKFLFSI